ncbi:hypothetical protein [Sinimarinibacterium sp. NLF-5-8]|uniref:hypothetical protein n=1 Tax=Sinimarinibacterium sp. NLF-5-8 TaxID=2698684 RepID=UPI00137C38D7|nr:hypothetical protein [Sinimarinibacterium sp. NLF-5-8]QHS09057.1 hypothetical protein GT972_02115 [Sinimarinibacterium sp. NLF-5-8]
MKKVINIIDGIPKIDTVPDDYIECSVSGEYRPPAEFQRDGKMVRTNCLRTFNLPDQFFAAEKKRTAIVKASREYLRLARQLEDQTNQLSASMPVEDLIAALQALPAGSRVCIEQDGYYAHGAFACLYEKPQEVSGSALNEPLFSLGQSSQPY